MTATSGELAAKASDLGRHVYGFAAFAFGVMDLAWHDINDWQQLRTLWSAPHGAALLYTAASAQVLGGIALQWRRSARWGAVVLGLVYLFFAWRWVPRIVAEPTIYDRWGNLFEQLSLVAAALIVYASAAPGSLRSSTVWLIGRYLFAVCVVSFTLEQSVYLSGTAGLVPKWLPPGPMFWAVTTTSALALAAVSLLSGRLVIPASRLLTAMFVIFGLLVWLPRVLSDPHDHTNWGGNAQNLAITGAAWIVADLLSRTHPASVLRRA
jgi:uncharacterized membrane protein YphA (DoxX/SURF4 family)